MKALFLILQIGPWCCHTSEHGVVTTGIYPPIGIPPPTPPPPPPNLLTVAQFISPLGNASPRPSLKRSEFPEC